MDQVAAGPTSSANAFDYSSSSPAAYSAGNSGSQSFGQVGISQQQYQQYMQRQQQQQQQQQHYVGGNVAASPIDMQYTSNQPQFNYPYPSAAYPTPNAAAPAPTPMRHSSPNHSNQPTPPNLYPMAAPPLPQTPMNAHLASANSGAATSPQTPQSPGTQGREQTRIAALLEINVELLQEVSKLQSEGQGGAITSQQQAQLKSQGQPDTLASEDYIQCMRRVQANLGYLMPRAQNDPSKIPQGPIYMSPPPHMPQLQGKYDQLRELFPGWMGLEHKMSGFSSGSPNPNAVAGAS